MTTTEPAASEADVDERSRQPVTTEEIEAELQRRGHIVTSWEGLGSITIENTGVITSQYRVGLPSENSSPAIFKAYFPPHCRIEAHTHDCDYSEIILQGSQQVSGRWLREGDIRIGLANKGYGPLVAGPEGVTVLVIFADGNWPAVEIGAGDGSTLGTSQLTESFTSSQD